MTRKKGTKGLNVNLPLDLYVMLKKLSIDKRITISSIIIQYLQYLKNKHHKSRKVLNEDSTSDFELDERESE